MNSTLMSWSGAGAFCSRTIIPSTRTVEFSGNMATWSPGAYDSSDAPSVSSLTSIVWRLQHIPIINNLTFEKYLTTVTRGNVLSRGSERNVPLGIWPNSFQNRQNFNQRRRTDVNTYVVAIFDFLKNKLFYLLDFKRTFTKKSSLNI